MLPTTHPLLALTDLPDFSAFKAESIEPALDEILAISRQRIAELLESVKEPTWENIVAPLEEWDDQLTNFWSPVSHLNSVANSDALREAYNLCLPKLTAYSTEMGQNQALFNAYQSIANSEHYQTLDAAQRQTIDNALRNFKLSGIALDEQARARFADIQQRLSVLSTQFSNNVLDATHGWYKHIDDASQLAGLPATAMGLYKQLAEAKSLPGYVVSLDLPAYLPFMQYADNRALREELYRAYNTRASELGQAMEGKDASVWNNSAIIDEILQLRQELAALLGFANYSERSLATKMAENTDQVQAFLEDLANHSQTVAQADFAELATFAKRQGLTDFKAWDVPYYSEKLRLEKYAISQEQIRPYFPADKVIDGLFTIVNRLFGVTIDEQKNAPSWHPDARLFTIKKQGEIIAKFYFDIYSRNHKRGGAWMSSCRIRRKRVDGSMQLPVAFLVCNFTEPTADTPSLLTHNEVTTLFHEFGHGLHHMLTQIDYSNVSGINGVAWDAVELPSQFLENWCWEKEAIALISSHYESGEVLPDSLLEKMLAAKNYQAGMQMMRQVEFALFDFNLHEITAKNIDVQAVLNAVRKKTSVYALPDFNRFQNSFTHVFAGGYAAGYYSYKWAEVLSADAFSRFEEEGIFNEITGQSFLNSILAMGGSKEPMELFVQFRGRKPNTEALLRHAGIVKKSLATEGA